MFYLQEVIIYIGKGILDMTIGERIKFRREELGMSQDELAKKLGYKSRSSINKIELNHYDLKQNKIKDIADALETTPSYVMGWDEEIEQSKENEKFIDIINNLELTEEQKLEVIKYARAIKLMAEQGDI